MKCNTETPFIYPSDVERHRAAITDAARALVDTINDAKRGGIDVNVGMGTDAVGMMRVDKIVLSLVL